MAMARPANIPVDDGADAPADDSAVSSSADAEGQAAQTLLSLAQVSRVAGVSRTTARRYVKSGRLPNAFKDQAGLWVVPISDLFSAGLRVDRVEPVARVEAVARPIRDSLEADLDLLRTENAVLRERLAASESIARERQERIEDLRLALRMLPEVWAERFEHMLAGVTGQTPPPPALAEQASDSDSASSIESKEAAAEPDPWAEIQRLQRLLEEEHAEHDRLLEEARRRRWRIFRRRARV